MAPFSSNRSQHTENEQGGGSQSKKDPNCQLETQIPSVPYNLLGVVTHTGTMAQVSVYLNNFQLFCHSYQILRLMCTLMNHRDITSHMLYETPKNQRHGSG